MINFVGKIIDFEIKGNIVKYYLGKKTEDWGWTNKDFKKNKETPSWLEPIDDYYGDDWDSKPYEHNASLVYDHFIYNTRIYYYDMDWIVVEPCSGVENSNYCKNDFKNRKMPCVIVIKGELAKKYSNQKSYSFWWKFINSKRKYNKQDTEAFYLEDILGNGETWETDNVCMTF